MGDDMSTRLPHKSWLIQAGNTLPGRKIFAVLILMCVPLIILGTSLAMAGSTYQTTPTLTITKTNSDATFVIGGVDPIYQISVRNDGSSVVTGTITVQDNLPAGLTYVAAAGTGWDCPVPTGQLLTCVNANLSGLAAGASTEVINLVVEVGQAAAPAVTNTASVIHNTTTIDTDSITKSVESADLRVTKSVSNANPAEGDQVTFTINLGNHGPSAA